jgi:hypothetical protein
MNSGRSFGRQLMSISFSTWLTTAPPSFTAGESSALTKCSGTFMWIFLFASTRWKSMCSTERAVRVHLHVAQEHLLRLAVELHRQDRRVERLVLERVHQRVVVELDLGRLAGPAVDDPGGLAAAAQAARGASPFASRAREGGEFDLGHRCDSFEVSAASGGGRAPCRRPRVASWLVERESFEL